MSAVLFDLDRTLIDLQSFTDYEAALADVRAIVGAWDEPSPIDGWEGPTSTALGLLAALTGDPRWAEVSDAIERHEMAGVDQSVAMPGLDEILATSERLPRAVVTSLAPKAARAALDYHGVRIDVLVARSSELRPKPAPDQLLEACRQLRVHHADAIMIGDTPNDHAAAVSAGCGFTGVTNHGPNTFAENVEVFAGLSELARRVE